MRHCNLTQLVPIALLVSVLSIHSISPAIAAPYTLQKGTAKAFPELQKTKLPESQQQKLQLILLHQDLLKELYERLTKQKAAKRAITYILPGSLHGGRHGSISSRVPDVMRYG